MVRVVEVVLVGLCYVSVALAVEEDSNVCGFGGRDACPQQRRGQALLQQQRAGSYQGVLETEEHASRSPAAYVQVGSSGISLPPQLAMWTNGSAGLMQLKEQAWHHATSSSKTSPDGSVPLEQWISETLIPQAQMTIGQLNQEIEAAWEEVNSCSTNKGKAEEGIADDKTFLTSAESRSSDCEVKSKEQHQAADAACSDLKNLYMGWPVPQPELITMVADGSNYTTDAIYSEIQKFAGFVKQSADAFEGARQNCEEKSGGDAHIATECLEDRHGIEKSYCSLKKAQMDICADFAGCYDEKKGAFDKVKSDVAKLETHVKANFKAMTCWNTGSSDCEAQAVNADHLSVTMKEAPNKEACSNDIGSSWDHSHVECPELKVFEEEAESAAPAPEVVPTTQTPASPAAPAGTAAPPAAPIAPTTVPPTPTNTSA